MTLDPAARAVLDALAHQPNIFELDPVAARAAVEATPKLGTPAPVASVTEIGIPGVAGDIGGRLYEPHPLPSGDDPAGQDGRRPALLWLHGGGWTLGSVANSDRTIRSVAAACGALTLAIDYRLAPEHPFPAAVDDAWAALRWLATHAGEHGGDGQRLAVAGDSAGANLAAVLCLMARGAGGPPIRFQGLVYPSVDFDFDTPSYRDNADGHYLTRRAMQRFADNYVPDAAVRADWRAAPARARHHRNLPPALIVTAEHDPTRDDGARYARLLAAAGVPVDHHDAPGMIHGFFSMPAALPAGALAQQALAAGLRDALAPTTTSTHHDRSDSLDMPFR